MCGEHNELNKNRKHKNRTIEIYMGTPRETRRKKEKEKRWSTVFYGTTNR